VCVARKPRCPDCVIRELCEYRNKTPGEAEVKPQSLVSRMKESAGRAPGRPKMKR
jgi:endonuclease III